MSGRAAWLAGLAAALLMATPTPGLAQGDDADRARVVVAPPSTLGNVSRSRRAARIAGAIEMAIGAVPGVELVATREVDRALRRTRRPALRGCEGDVACLAEAGAAVDARFVVASDLGGLGSAQVVYLKVVDVARRREVRSTTLEIVDSDDLAAAARAAAMRLLRPNDYIGRLAVDLDVDGATVYVDGKAAPPGEPLALPVGTHALRITHPEYRDFVRFVDIDFDETRTVDVDMQAYPIVTSDMTQRQAPYLYDESGARIVRVTPWYRRWYTVAGAGAIFVAGSVITAALLAGGIDADREETVGD